MSTDHTSHASVDVAAATDDDISLDCASCKEQRESGQQETGDDDLRLYLDGDDVKLLCRTHALAAFGNEDCADAASRTVDNFASIARMLRKQTHDSQSDGDDEEREARSAPGSRDKSGCLCVVPWLLVVIVFLYGLARIVTANRRAEECRDAFTAYAHRNPPAPMTFDCSKTTK